MSAEQSRAIRYLLGKLGEDEAEAVAERFFASDEWFAEVEDAENVLVETYLDEGLTADDRQRFESRFLSSPPLRERVELERALRLRALGQRRGPASRPARLLPWAAALVFGLAGGGLALQERVRATRERGEAHGRERALAEHVAVQDERLRALEGRLAAGATSDVSTWNLEAGTDRSDGDAPPFTVDSPWVRLRLPRDVARPGATFRASLRLPEGREVFHADGLSSQPADGGPVVDIIVPGGVLPRGTYVLFVTRVAPGRSQELGPYSFAVRAQ